MYHQHGEEAGEGSGSTRVQYRFMTTGTVWACLNNSTRSTHGPPIGQPGKQAVMTGSALALKPQVTGTVEPT